MMRRILPHFLHLRRFSRSKTLPNGSNLLNMPALSPTMASGNISNWSLEEGQSFSPGDLLCEVETDKATVDFEALDDGFLATVLVGSRACGVTVGSPIAIVTETEEALEAVKQLNFTLNDFKQDLEETATTSGFLEVSATPEVAKLAKRSSPAANLLAKNLNLDLETLQGTGKHGIITKTDVLVASGAVSSVKTAERSSTSEIKEQQDGFSDVPLSGMRRIIASRMVESKAASVHSYMSIKCDVDNANALRKRFKAEFGRTFSLNDLVVLVSAKSLESAKQLLPRNSNTIDVSVAVATQTGLITPIVKDASRLTLLQLNSEVKLLAERAREGKLGAEEYTGGSFTVSNLGMLDISSFTAVINQPQRAILAIGGSKKKLRRKDDVIDWVTEMEVTLSFDRKKITEKSAAEFLQRFKLLFSDPTFLLV